MCHVPAPCVCVVDFAFMRMYRDQGRRRMVGCYIGMDELESMSRVHGV